MTTHSFIPKRFHVENWGRIGNQTLIPSEKGNLILTGGNGSGKTSTMSVFWPFLISGRTTGSNLFNTFETVDLQNPNKKDRKQKGDRDLATSILGSSDGDDKVMDQNGNALTNAIAHANMTFDNGLQAITIGIQVSIEQMQPKHERWFILVQPTQSRPDLITNDGQAMLSPKNFAKANLAEFEDSIQLFDNGSAYRNALVKTLFGQLPAGVSADDYINTYVAITQAIGSPNATGKDKPSMKVVTNNFNTIATPIDNDKILEALRTVNTFRQDKEQINVLETLIHDVEVANEEAFMTHLVKAAIEIDKNYRPKSEKLQNIKNNITELKDKQEDLTQSLTTTQANIVEAEGIKQKTEVAYYNLKHAVDDYDAAKRRYDSDMRQSQQIIDQYKQHLAEIEDMDLAVNIATKTLNDEKFVLSDMQEALTKSEKALIALRSDLAKQPLLTDITSLTTVDEIKQEVNRLNKIQKLLRQRQNKLDLLPNLGPQVINFYQSIEQRTSAQTIAEVKPVYNDEMQNIQEPTLAQIEAINAQLPNAALKMTADDVIILIDTLRDTLIDLLTTMERQQADVVGSQLDVSKAEENLHKVKAKQTDLLAKTDKLKEDAEEAQRLIDDTDAPVKPDTSDLIAAENEKQQSEKVLNAYHDRKTQIQTTLADITEQLESQTHNEAITTSEIENSIRRLTVNHLPKLQTFKPDLDIDTLKTLDIDPELFSLSVYAKSFQRTVLGPTLHATDLAVLKDKLTQQLLAMTQDQEDELSLEGRLIEQDLDMSAYKAGDALTTQLSQLVDELAHAQQRQEENNVFLYNNNTSINDLINDEITKLDAFNDTLTNTEAIMAGTEDSKSIRVRMSHEILDQPDSFDQRLINAETAQDKNQVLSDLVDTVLANTEKYENLTDLLNHADTTIPKLVAPLLDYRNRMVINMQMARAGSDVFNNVTDTILRSGSGGERTHIMITPLLVIAKLHLDKTTENAPRLLYFDEMASYLDTNNTAALIELVDRLNFSFFATVPEDKETAITSTHVPTTTYHVRQVRVPNNGHPYSVNRYAHTIDTMELSDND